MGKGNREQRIWEQGKNPVYLITLEIPIQGDQKTWA
ncbi:hypothetical protein LYNGBM3L_25820 [Moorena producens 3L]|uniref:Uncharacterized protein n=1 Tax=Moorena producens 3L TaxID=489825 RepID=F4XNT8_9CYAN|nr:hypothetical protein LYNGBM3L_25820 [Moorena producens 3L]